MKTISLSFCDTCGVWNGTDLNCRACKSPCSKRDVPAKRGGQYFVNGIDRALPSVTAIQQVLAKPALTYWLKQKVAEAVFADPTISLADAISAPDKVRDVAASKGGDIHKIIEAHAKGQKINIEDYSDPWRKHVEAYLKFCQEVPHKIMQSEQIVYSKKHNYAGQLDCIAEIGGRIVLMDWKTNKSLYPKDHVIQCSGYRLALEEMGYKIDTQMIVHLKVDGTYTLMELEYRPEIFLATLLLFNYQNS